MLARQHGVSIIEMMIAMTLSLLVGLSAFAFYFQLKANYAFQQGLNRILQNAQIIHFAFKNAIAGVGSLGCLAVDFAIPIYGQDRLPIPIQADTMVREQYNRLMVQQAQSSAHKLVMNMFTERAPITVERGISGITSGDIAVISDCEQADIFTVSSVSTSGQSRTIYHTQQPLSKAYAESAEVSVWNVNEYYIDESHYKNKQGKITKGLFVHNLLTGRSEEIVQGVEDWRLYYAVDSNQDGVVDKHQTASAIDDWSQVNGVIIYLLLTSVDEVLTVPSDYDFLGERYHATDRLLRKEIDLYIALRNPLHRRN